MSTKACSKCSTPFECCNEKMGCWCEDLSLELKTLKALKEQFDNCLCPTCLSEYSNDQINN